MPNMIMPAAQQSAQPNTMPATFFRLYLNEIRVGAALTFEADELFSGSWVQPMGDDEDLIRQPGMRSGRGSFSRVQLFGSTLRDVVISSKEVTADDIAQGRTDFRFLPLTAAGRYNDGIKQISVVLINVYLTRIGWRVDDGTRLVSESSDFEFSKLLQQ